ncbi:MAG: hypothetical protein AMXMBFR81_13020 [Chthonomonas sp.]
MCAVTNNGTSPARTRARASFRRFAAPPGLASRTSVSVCRNRAICLARVPGLGEPRASGPSVAEIAVPAFSSTSRAVPSEVLNTAVWPLMSIPGMWPEWTVVTPNDRT